MRTITTLAAAAAMSVGLFGAAFAQESVTLRIYHSTSPSSTYAKTIAHLGERLQELTDGQIKVKEFGGGTLGTETTTLDMYETGDLDIGFHHTSPTSTVVKPLGFFDVPFLFDDFDHWKRSVISDSGKEIINGWIKESGRPFSIAMIGLGGERSIYTKSTIFKTIDDMQGFKIRVTESPTAFKVWRAIGMAPVGLPWNDVYSALESGLIEGVDNTPGWYNDARHIEVAKNWFWTRHLYATQLVLIGDHVWENVPSDLHDELKQALGEAEEWWIAEQVKFDQNAVDTRFDAMHVIQHEVSPELLGAIRERVEPLAGEAAAEFGAQPMLELINEKRGS